MAFDYKKTKQQVKAHLAKRFLFILREEDTFEEVANYTKAGGGCSAGTGFAWRDPSQFAQARVISAPNRKISEE